jgi:pseudaminic acid synthase
LSWRTILCTLNKQACSGIDADRHPEALDDMSWNTPCTIIAELSANHGQEESRAFALVQAAKDSGADVVKVQTYTPDTITYRSRQPAFLIGDQALWKGRYLWDLYQEAFTPWEWQPGLRDFAHSLGLGFIASVFDPVSVDFWEEHGLERYKIASAELVDIPLLQAVASTGKPMVVSTGMATLTEITEAVHAIRERNPSVDLTLLKCSSAYPAPISSMNLRGIQTLSATFGTRTGLSDHTLADEVAVTAVGLGATVFEKHLKLEDARAGPDDAFSLTPLQFTAWAASIRRASLALGSPTLEPTSAEYGTLPFRKSLFVTLDIQPGETFTGKNLRSIRPASGLHPRYYHEILGRRASAFIPAGTPLTWAQVEGGQSHSGS